MSKDWFGWVRRLFGLAGEAENRLILEGIARLNEDLDAQHLTVRNMSDAMNNLVADQMELHQKIDMIISTIDRIHYTQDDGMKQIGLISREVKNLMQEFLDDYVESGRQELLVLSERIDDTTKTLNLLGEQTGTLAGEIHANHTASVNLAKESNGYIYTALTEGSKGINEAALQSKKRDEDLLKSLQAIWMVELSNQLEKEVERR
ncbi:hypothetical protein [Exiguobacterium sp. S22-S28]|uniref:hypothetical protein n=1 Tax=Exiguobacterium sp. S22-S28 TaxID=3342768 RepID=UPI00372D7EDE